jgi:hypothetical protein
LRIKGSITKRSPAGKEELKMARPILINGKFVEAKSNSTIEVHNPATLEILDSVPACGEADVNAAVSAARAAQRDSGNGGDFPASPKRSSCTKSRTRSAPRNGRSGR